MRNLSLLRRASRPEVMSPRDDVKRVGGGRDYDGTHIRQRRQNRDLVRSDATAGTGGSALDNSDARFGEPIAFFTALQIISRENGFSRKSDIPSFSALNATALYGCESVGNRLTCLDLVLLV
jgi:hypothetical protein